MAGKHGGPPATQDKDTAAPDQKRRQEEQFISYMSRIISTSRISNDNTQSYVVFGALLTFAFLEAKMFIDIFDLSSMGLFGFIFQYGVLTLINVLFSYEMAVGVNPSRSNVFNIRHSVGWTFYRCSKKVF